MRTLAIGLLTTVLVVGFAPAGEDAVKQDMKLLQGTWIVQSAERDGKPHDRIQDDKLVISGDQITIKSKERDEEASYRIDPSKTPKRMDITPKSEKNERVEGIYELKGDTLKLCFARSGNPRPPEFKTTEGSRRMLIVLKRAK